MNIDADDFLRPPPNALRSEVMEEWLQTGIPNREVIVRRHSLDYDWAGGIQQRQQVISRIGFGIPCHEAIAACVGTPLIEAGAGSGFWSALIAHYGGDVIACDTGQGAGRGTFKIGRYFDVQQMSAEDMIQQNPDRDLLMVWPTLNGEWATAAARMLTPGRRLYLVSEGLGGCVGAASLFRLLETGFEFDRRIDIPRWPYMHDEMTVHVRL